MVILHFSINLEARLQRIVSFIYDGVLFHAHVWPFTKKNSKFLDLEVADVPHSSIYECQLLLRFDIWCHFPMTMMVEKPLFLKRFFYRKFKIGRKSDKMFFWRRQELNCFHKRDCFEIWGLTLSRKNVIKSTR